MSEGQISKSSDVQTIKIDPWSVIKIILILIGFFILYLIRDVILVLIVAIILAAVVSSIVDTLEKRGIHRGFGALFVYLLLLAILAAVVVPLVPLISHQFNYLIGRLPAYYQAIAQFLKVEQKVEFNFWQEFFKNWFGGLKISGTIFDLLGSVIGWIFVVFLVFVIAFYMSVQKNLLRETLKFLLPVKYKERLAIAFDLAQREIGEWLRGLFILSLSVGLMAFIGLTILDARYALLLSAVAGLTEIIPWIGPWLGGAIAVMVTFVYSPIKALLVAALFAVIQLIENHFLVPQVMKKSVGLNPLLVIIILLIGGKLAGPVGVFLAVPIVVIARIFVREYLICQKLKS